MARRGRNRWRDRKARQKDDVLEGEELEARLKALRRSSGPYGKKRRRHGRARRLRRATGTILLLLLLAAVLYGVYAIVSAAFGGEPATATVSVEEGETLAEVADKLEEAGVVGSSTVFKLQARVEGGDTEIKPGEYRIRKGTSAETIIATLSSEERDVSTYAVTIPEGLTIRQAAQEVEAGGGPTAAEFEKAAGSTDYGYAFLDDPAVKSTEGFLFPKRYELEKGTDARGLVDRLLEQYLIETQGLDFAGARGRLNLTEYQLLIVASLVERESANPEERPVIASVIYNRLRRDMPLQIDASVQYALGEPRERLSLEDLEVDSPYNTYANRGLPPGPIASPSRESIQAALEPARTDHLYYVLEAGGEKHFFTNDYDEFLAAKEEAGY